MTRVTIGMIFLVACGDRKPPPVVVEDAKRSAVVDAMPIDAPSPYVADERKESFETFVDIHRRDGECPSLDWRRRAKSVAIKRCRDKPLGAQVDTLKDLVAYARTIDGIGFEEARLVGGLDFWGYPEFAKRLVEYARKTPYDPKIGLNKYTLDAANTADLTPELSVIFQRKVKVLSLEKCSSGRPTRKDENGAWLRENGVTENREFPLGCSMAFIEFTR